METIHFLGRFLLLSTTVLNDIAFYIAVVHRQDEIQNFICTYA